MKILNVNKKLKFSKMFIDEKVYRAICDKHGVPFDLHLARLESISNFEPDANLLNEQDLKIVLEVYTRITKVIRGDEKKWQRQKTLSEQQRDN